ncbi:MAG: hypothetical protein ACETWR_10340 [Anaerolineae bacterium]
MAVDSLLARTARHLQLAMSPQEYEAFRDQYRDPDGRRYIPDDGYYDDEDNVRSFWEHIPEYLIARCPLCGASFTERMDTYSLEDWMLGFTDAVYYGGEQRHIGCYHFVGVQSFINLNSIVPTEPSYYRGESEVPYVMPIFLPDDPVSYVVMHSLPICRVENDTFVPRYSLFMLTYYSQDPHVLLKRNTEHWKPGMGMISPMYPFSSDRDLLKWVVAGKLWWLDLDRDDLSLKSGPVEEFPYGNIEGRDRPFTYRKGRLGKT